MRNIVLVTCRKVFSVYICIPLLIVNFGITSSKDLHWYACIYATVKLFRMFFNIFIWDVNKNFIYILSDSKLWVFLASIYYHIRISLSSFNGFWRKHIHFCLMVFNKWLSITLLWSKKKRFSMKRYPLESPYELPNVTSWTKSVFIFNKLVIASMYSMQIIESQAK